MSIRNAGKISGSGKEIYGEYYEERNPLSKRLEKLLEEDTYKISKSLKKALEKVADNFNIIKMAIYAKDKETQKLGWTMYHNLPSKDQKAFKSEIRAEEKARKTK